MACNRKIGPHDCCSIVQGDCLELMKALPDGCVDAVITDPPYGMNFRSNHRIERHGKIFGDDYLPLENIRAAILKARRFSYVFCRWDNLKEMPRPRSVLAWVKNNWSMGDLRHEHGRQWEAICFYPDIFHEFIKRIPDVLYADRTGNELHPTQKPEWLIEQLIADNVCESILDPFAGSGTMQVAAKKLGRHFLGFEISAEYCQIARDRIARIEAQPILFEPKPEQMRFADKIAGE